MINDDLSHRSLLMFRWHSSSLSLRKQQAEKNLRGIAKHCPALGWPASLILRLARATGGRDVDLAELIVAQHERLGVSRSQHRVQSRM
jgi:hypothetical protein